MSGMPHAVCLEKAAKILGRPGSVVEHRPSSGIVPLAVALSRELFGAKATPPAHPEAGVGPQLQPAIPSTLTL